MSVDRFAETFTSWGAETGQSRLTIPVTIAQAVTFPGNADFTPTNVSRALYVGSTGDITVDMFGGGTGILFKDIPIGWHPIRVTKIYYAGTNASYILSCD